MRETGSPGSSLCPQAHSGGKLSRRYRPRGLSTPQSSRSASFASTFISVGFCPHPRLQELAEQAPGTPTPALGTALASGAPSPLPALGPHSALEPRPHSQEEAHLLSSEGRGRWPPPRSGVGVRAEPGRSRRSEAGGQPKPAPPQLQARVEPRQSRCKRVSN